MAAETRTHSELEIGHVLFMDVVDYSKLLINEQREIQGQLTQIVRGTEHFRAAEAYHLWSRTNALPGVCSCRDIWPPK
jgi:hypothetical protein